MREFFNYQSPYRTNIWLDLNIFERIIPVIIVLLLIYIIYKYKDVLKENKVLDKRIRYISGIILFIVYVSHYLLRFNLYKFDTIILPFHLCSVAMFLAVILLFTKNKTIFTFVFMAGLLGGVISFANPIIGYNSNYYRYYQFMIAHGILMVTPFYFLFVYDYIPRRKDIINAYIILQSLALFMLVFNYFMGTDFMFMFIDPSKIDKFPVIKNFGGIPYYLIVIQIVAFAYFYISYIIFDYLANKKENVLEGGEIYESN